MAGEETVDSAVAESMGPNGIDFGSIFPEDEDNNPIVETTDSNESEVLEGQDGTDSTGTEGTEGSESAGPAPVEGTEPQEAATSEVDPDPEPSPQETVAEETQATAPVDDPNELIPGYTSEQLWEQFGPRLEGMYALTDDETAGMQTEPETVLPKIAARLHFQAVGDAISYAKQLIPSIVQQQLQSHQAAQSAWEQFYTINNDLRGKVTQDQILKVETVYRTLHPKATKEQLMKGVGDLVRNTLGMSTSQAAPETTTQATQQANSNNPRPFTPALGKGGTGTVKTQDNSVWSDIAEQVKNFED